jgi:hypothetical protein
MKEYYITFGQAHTHSHNGITLDKDCVGVIKAESFEKMRALAFGWFDGVFGTTYTPEEFGDSIKHFPRGFINLN